MIKENSMEFLHKLLETYGELCKPLCRKLQIPQTAFDILMFLGNHPNYNSARDIVEIRGIKANLVSINVDKLVLEGYLERIPAPDDRRKTILLCTEQAAPIIEQGRCLQHEFYERLFEGIDEETYQVLCRSVATIQQNLYKLWEEEV